MGLFSSKYVTTVGTSVSRVIEDKQIPDPIHTGGVKALTVSGDTVEYVMEELVGSVGIKAGSLYRYAKDNYTYGLPSGQYIRADAGKSQVISTIQSSESLPITIEYSHYGPVNSKHIAWITLVKDYQYNPVSNEISKLSLLKGFPVYLDSLQVLIPPSYLTEVTPSVLEQWGVPDNVGYTPERPIKPLFTKHSPLIVDSTLTEDFIRISYIWEDSKTVNDVVTKTIMKESVMVPIIGYKDAANYFHVKYTVNSIPKYWLYESGSGQFPTLDSLFSTPQLSGGSFFPMSYIRFDKKSTVVDKTTAEYKSTKKMLKYLNMDFDYLAETINSNPNAANVEQAILTFAIPANSTESVDCRYLFDFFSALQESTGSSDVSNQVASVGTKLSAGNTTKNNEGTIVIQDKKFKMQLKHSGIYRTYGLGKKCAVGKYTSAETLITSTFNFTRREDEYSHKQSTQTRAVKQHYYFRQITEDVYEQVAVVGLTMTYFILEGYTVTAGDSDPILMVPLDYSITKDYPSQTETILYSRSLHFIFNSKNVQELKWYQQKWFSYVLLIIAIIITILDWGSDGGSAIGAAMAAGTITTAAIIEVIIIVVLQLVVSQAIKLFVKVLGAKGLFVLALIAAYYGVTTQPGDLIGPLAMTATSMLKLALNLTGMAYGVDLQEKFNTLKQEASKFEKEKEAALKLLETEDELLNSRHHIRPMDIMGESPSDYFNRTAHSGNIGVTTIGMVSSYVDMALRLPTVNQSNQTLMRYT